VFQKVSPRSYLTEKKGRIDMQQLQVTPSPLSSYQQKTIVLRMLDEARQLSRIGLPRSVVMQQVAILRDCLVGQALTDISLRQQRGHLR
jgi:hypothetical protein